MATPLTFDNPLKFGLDSCHKTKGWPTFLHWERKHPKLRTNNMCTTISRWALQQGPARVGAIAMVGGWTRARNGSGGFSIAIPNRGQLSIEILDALALGTSFL